MSRKIAVVAGPVRRFRVGDPLVVDGTKAFLIGHGYAPVITIRDGEGNKVYSGPTIFHPASNTPPSLATNQ